jgi:hypothetical protein
MHVVHSSEGQRGKSTVAAYCRFLGQAEQKNGQHGEVSADFEHSLDELKTRLEKTKIGMLMFNSTKFETKIIIIIIIIIISQSLKRLNLHPNTYIQMQKSVILGTCSIVRNFLNYK